MLIVDNLEWNDEGNIPEKIEAAGVNQWLFNKDTVDKVLEHLTHIPHPKLSQIKKALKVVHNN
ncbi:hypothetical protein BMF77_01973 [Dolichospermum sp. UHCC 0315A]|uniref:hypothetical protein n=1 Tax=Dolichospermum TaxID=748770 RepID=UPI0011E77A04|nr:MULTISPECIES: hypothetical protein [Dolichospermum]MDB9435641.1 hypothetical protein [Dolichospermum lemmermannii CS-548]QEI41388.1 hypothetical protein BMF77_01973 [Dolichospermum sp. UHCC 0315A]